MGLLIMGIGLTTPSPAPAQEAFHPQTPQPDGIDTSKYKNPAPDSMFEAPPPDPDLQNVTEFPLDVLGLDPILAGELAGLLGQLSNDATLMTLSNTGQSDSAPAFALAQRTIMAQLQSINRWTQIQALASLVQSNNDSLTLKAIMHCVSTKLEMPRPVDECITSGGSDPIGAYLNIKTTSIMADYLEPDQPPWVFTYVGDLRLQTNRIRRIFCDATDPNKQCRLNNVDYTYRHLSYRFDEMVGGIEAVVQADCDKNPIPATVQWNGSLPASAAIQVDRTSFLQAFGNTEICPILKRAMAATALSREVSYVLTLLSTAESEPGAYDEERAAIRMVREDLERRFT